MTLVDTSTVLFIISIIGCLIGVLTFISGINAKAKRDGVFEQKLDQAVSGIGELKKDLKAFSQDQSNLSLLVASHGEQIKALRQAQTNNQMIEEALTEILKTLKS